MPFWYNCAMQENYQKREITKNTFIACGVLLLVGLFFLSLLAVGAALLLMVT
jgi:hypothetical protein